MKSYKSIPLSKDYPSQAKRALSQAKLSSQRKRTGKEPEKKNNKGIPYEECKKLSNEY